MAIPKDKQRITITIHNETKALLNELLSLHDNSSYSTIIEIALMVYAKIISEQLEKGEKENEKN
ncbi:MAG: hypothetical protein J6S67_05440 [Methanobrevibacter sp.]|nr:hypothetical protein [Methanobrevibacter sp.]